MDIPWNITYDGVDNQSSLFPGGCVEICRMPSYSTSINFYTPPGSYAYSASVAPSTPNEIGIYKPINKNISNPGQPLGIAFDSLNKEIFVADYADNKTSIINTSTNTVINNITGFAHPYILVFDPANKLLYISDYGANKITVVNTTSDAVLKNISTPSSNSVLV
jgi:40-residue YVTN family beta-propeller repeat